MYLQILGFVSGNCRVWELYNNRVFVVSHGSENLGGIISSHNFIQGKFHSEVQWLVNSGLMASSAAAINLAFNVWEGT